jgi:glycosyltransferase involved in cell wall biosynthesis
LIVSPEPEPLAGAIRTLISDREVYRKFQGGTKAVAAELGWDRLSEQMEGYYAKALGSRNGHN